MAARDELDSDLGVQQWRISAFGRPRPTQIEPGAPAWWHGDEDASQSFLTAMGVSLP